MKTILSIRRISTTLAATAATVGLLLIAAPLPGAGPASHHASGGGHFVASGGGVTSEFMFAFNARQLKNNGGVKGQFEFHNITNGTLLHMKIIYAEFLDETTVGLIGEVTKSVGGNAKVGDCRAVKLQDNGEGKNAPLDMTSKLSNKCSSDILTATNGWFDLALIPIDSGNIQIR
jgi:hypothetical protein